MEHLPTIEAGIRYWEAVRVWARRAHDAHRERTAAGLRLSYEAARYALKAPRGRPLADRTHRGRDLAD
jgi:hypothetical protein